MKKHNRRVSTLDAIRLHAEANKSDPFAARRMEMTLRKRHDNPKDVADEAQRILDTRAAAIRKAFAEWIKTPEGKLMRKFVQAGRTYGEKLAA
ncbi:hypothetical protein UP09_03210 [Bradyrhizobium sp. LTSP885]|uniref:hypothetical protein n=1 Tax=Bradyrhizobium sp. LTSP885 TaxID=1619232 RepID=UPI0005C88947|nr:hypothetical protein [Bradyrhizobium sp. LTSP885]KJC51069.1 hypothetical protein UP09_03210 [Bradyrhizobium sp. LTSP885]